MSGSSEPESLADCIASRLANGFCRTLAGVTEAGIAVILSTVLTPERLRRAQDAAAGHGDAAAPRAWTSAQIDVLEAALVYARQFVDEAEAERYAVAIALGLTPAVEQLAEAAARRGAAPAPEWVAWWRARESDRADRRVAQEARRRRPLYPV